MNQDADNYSSQAEANDDSTRTTNAAERIADALEAIAEDLHCIAACFSIGLNDLQQIRDKIVQP